jgi:nucleoside-diphosphate-sugar epimerase
LAARTVYLTGATGFIGGALARRLAARGDRLRCLVRNADRAAALRKLGAELIVGDVVDQHAHEQGMKGCSLAYHLAAIYDVGVVDGKALERTNVGGTAAFIEAIETTSLPRAVYVSTTGALGPTGSDLSDNVIEFDGPFPTHYHRTKAQGHKVARAAQERGDPLIIACPAFVYGPGDDGPAGRFLQDAVRGKLPGLLTDSAWFSYVHVDDVVAGLELMGERGTLGKVYVLSGEPVQLNTLAARAAKLAGKRLPLLRFPPVLAAGTGAVLDTLTRLTGKRFVITQEGVRSTAHGRWLHSHEPATRELNWHPRSLDEGLPETVRWIQQNRS